MRAILAAAIFCFLAAPASALGWNAPYGSVYQPPQFQVWFHDSGAAVERINGHRSAANRERHGLSPLCQIARSLGGPCGCFASEYFFGHSVRDLWPVSAWVARYPRVAPAAGTAAIWPGRHVAPVLANNGDGTVTVLDSWATHRVRIAGLVFVQPH